MKGQTLDKIYLYWSRSHRHDVILILAKQTDEVEEFVYGNECCHGGFESH